MADRLDSLAREVHALRRELDSTPAERVWDLLMKAAVPITIGLVAAALHLWRDVSIIQATRFTEEDAASMETRIRRELPPQWLRDDLEDIKAGLTSATTALGKLDSMGVRIDQIVNRQNENSIDIDALENALMERLK